MIGTRNGDILEAVVSQHFIGFKSEDKERKTIIIKDEKKMLDEDPSSLSENIEDEFGDQEKVKKNGTVSTMESSTQLTKLKSSSNFSMSSIHNTYCFNEAFDRSKAIGYRDNSTPLSDILKQRQFKTKDSGVRPMSNKNSKAVIKFNEAMEKAKIYNDQMIKQYQFDRENEEEEHDFVELCEILQTNLKE